MRPPRLAARSGARAVALAVRADADARGTGGRERDRTPGVNRRAGLHRERSRKVVQVEADRRARRTVHSRGRATRSWRDARSAPGRTRRRDGGWRPRLLRRARSACRRVAGGLGDCPGLTLGGAALALTLVAWGLASACCGCAGARAASGSRAIGRSPGTSKNSTRARGSSGHGRRGRGRLLAPTRACGARCSRIPARRPRRVPLDDTRSARAAAACRGLAAGAPARSSRRRCSGSSQDGRRLRVAALYAVPGRLALHVSPGDVRLKRGSARHQRDDDGWAGGNLPELTVSIGDERRTVRMPAAGAIGSRGGSTRCRRRSPTPCRRRDARRRPTAVTALDLPGSRASTCDTSTPSTRGSLPPRAGRGRHLRAERHARHVVHPGE